jgi:Glyoxalase-like domain
VHHAHYLETIAPDPAQTVEAWQFQLSGLTEPRLINFAVRTKDINRTAASLREAGVHTFDPIDGSRRTASGALLRWKTLGGESKFQSGAINPIPFFIELYRVGERFDTPRRRALQAPAPLTN